MAEVIMLQEEDESILDVLKLALEMEGFKVIPVLHCDDDVIDLIEKTRPHVVMLDVKLDGKDCIDICHKIKAKYPHLPVIALSCNVNINEVYAKEGFDAYISKPFDLDLLYKILRKQLPDTSISVDDH
jgi:DNA-binding response OmpR family regulator